MNKDTFLRCFQSRFFSRRPSPTSDFLLSDERFRFAADCERMRVDRNGSVLSLLLIRLPNLDGDPGTDFLARVLEGRLRATDTAGRLHDGRIAVLLPDTQEEGAWKVAADVSEVYPPGPGRPQCDVLVYPPRRRAETLEPGHAGTAPTAVDRGEFFFAKPVPRLKRSLDILGACCGLLVSAPAIAIAAAAIKATSSGPVFFGQEREGRGGRRFRMWKLRTMVADAEVRLGDLRTLSDQDGPAFKMRNDPRITRVGRLLRLTSLDELPQFWNVLVGDMSLVGPRPLPTRESLACEGWHRRRLTVNPGMTCTWQVLARGTVRFDDWVRMDLQYAQQPSVWRDVRLMLRTIPTMVLPRGLR